MGLKYWMDAYGELVLSTDGDSKLTPRAACLAAIDLLGMSERTCHPTIGARDVNSMSVEPDDPLAVYFGGLGALARVCRFVPPGSAGYDRLQLIAESHLARITAREQYDNVRELLTSRGNSVVIEALRETVRDLDSEELDEPFRRRMAEWLTKWGDAEPMEIRDDVRRLADYLLLDLPPLEGEEESEASVVSTDEIRRALKVTGGVLEELHDRNPLGFEIEEPPVL